MANSGDLATESAAYNVEFKSTVDDAWYTVRLLLSGDALTVKFFGFAAAWDERFSASDFASPDAVDEFCQRFRPPSVQAQDGQCAQIAEGKVVCASIASADGADVRYYDAVVEAVHHEKHREEEGEEVCSCTFVLHWQHGPKVHCLTPAKIDIISLHQYRALLDSRVATFAKLATERIIRASHRSSSVSIKSSVSVLTPKSISSQHRFQMEGTRGATAAVQTTEGRVSHCCHETNQDEDMGAESFDMNSIKESSSHHFVLIENLEKDLLPSSIMEFIHKQTSVSLQAYVFPSLSSESYTRGVIMLDCRAKLKKIIDFLSNPDHIIMSSTGRPWVISEKIMRPGTLEKTPGSLMPEFQYRFQDRAIDSKLKAVHSGTKEYRTAKRLRDLFTDFMNHQQRLHKRLALEERNILQPSHTV